MVQMVGGAQECSAYTITMLVLKGNAQAVKIALRDLFDPHTSRVKVRLTASYCIWRISY